MSLNLTKIEWVKNPDGTQGYTLNQVTGCRNHTPEGLCLGDMFPCYAYKLANGRLKRRYLYDKNAVIANYGNLPIDKAVTAENDPFYPRFWEERLKEPLSKVVPTRLGSIMYGQSPKGIFVCDMGELFGNWVPKEWQDVIFNYIKDYPEHRFYLLTKQPQNLPQFSPFPDNCWVGVTATDRHFANQAQKYMLKVEAKVKYLSIEPCFDSIPWELLLGYNWVIIGAQTNPYKPPKIEWVEEIVRACDEAGIPVFLKDNLKPLLDSAGCPFDFYYKGNLRQEMPR